MEKALDFVIDELKTTFEITCVSLNIFVGMQIIRNETDGLIFIHQQTYIEKLLTKFGMIEARTVSTPAEPHLSLELANMEKSINTIFLYREAVGSMFFATVNTPDIAYSVNVCA